MKRVGTGLLIVLAMTGLPGWACVGGTSSGVHNLTLSVISQTLYGARPDKIIQFTQGEKVIISVTADEPMQVFLHGYDVATWVKPGAASTLEFTADIPGRYPLMIHALGDEGSSHGKVEILLGLVDVLPGK
ncbi:MAG: hypothetical protein HY673_23995 [Chloroflexi bacterium]|nr:hypothetical protein [Chloroflexota bacterium]